MREFMATSVFFLSHSNMSLFKYPQYQSDHTTHTGVLWQLSLKLLSFTVQKEISVKIREKLELNDRKDEALANSKCPKVNQLPQKYISNRVKQKNQSVLNTGI